MNPNTDDKQLEGCTRWHPCERHRWRTAIEEQVEAEMHKQPQDVDAATQLRVSKMLDQEIEALREENQQIEKVIENVESHLQEVYILKERVTQMESEYN